MDPPVKGELRLLRLRWTCLEAWATKESPCMVHGEVLAQDRSAGIDGGDVALSRLVLRESLSLGEKEQLHHMSV